MSPQDHGIAADRLREPASAPAADANASGPSRMGFVGVTTGSSSIMRVFPQWADALGLPTRQLVGHDLPLHASAGRYRSLVSAIRADPRHLGALVTTHKMALFEAAADLFDEFDEYALVFGEVSSIAKRGGRLIGSAKDPVTVRLALEEFVPFDHFSRTGASAIVIGAGGAGNALSYQLGERADAPSRLIVLADSRAAADHARRLHERGGLGSVPTQFLVAGGPDEVDRAVAGLPPESLIVNATGMGKDRPGSPVPAATRFPERSLIWDFNYRGSLEFLLQARAQQVERDLRIEDGWRYFIHGWTQVIAEVFQIPMPPERVRRLSELAASAR